MDNLLKIDRFIINLDNVLYFEGSPVVSSNGIIKSDKNLTRVVLKNKESIIFNIPIHELTELINE